MVTAGGEGGINQKLLFKIQKITNGLIASKFFMGSRLYGCMESFYRGYPGSIGAFFFYEMT